MPARPDGLGADFGSQNRIRTAILGADDGIRTRDPNLGKVVLYQLSHVRVGEENSARGARAQVPASRATTGANCSYWSSPKTTYDTPHSSRRATSVSQTSSTEPARTAPEPSASSGDTPNPGAMASARPRASSVTAATK